MAGSSRGNLTSQELSEFMSALSTWTPTIPEEVIRHFLQRSGFVSSDPISYKLVSLVVQKFISDVANDALVYAKSQSNDIRAGRGKSIRAKQQVILTTDSLAAALENYGIEVQQPPYFVNASLPPTSSIYNSLGQLPPSGPITSTAIPDNSTPPILSVPSSASTPFVTSSSASSLSSSKKKSSSKPRAPKRQRN